jgi:hypothetical protein
MPYNLNYKQEERKEDEDTTGFSYIKHKQIEAGHESAWLSIGTSTSTGWSSCSLKIPSKLCRFVVDDILQKEICQTHQFL